jgi:DNA-binding response OmpR family regulator
LRRSVKKDLPSEKSFQFEDLEINDSQHIVKVCGQEVSLSPKEYHLILTLTLNKDITITREQLMKNVWGYDYYGGLRTVDTHINRLRIKLGKMGDYISTIRGFGYKFDTKSKT